MKKLFIILFVAGVLLTSGIYYWQANQKAFLAGSEINTADFNQLLTDDDPFYIYFYSETCDQCLAAETKLVEALKQVPVPLYNMDVAKNTAVFETYQQQLGLPGVPVILRFTKGEVTGGVAGAPESTDVYVEFFSEEAENQQPDETVKTGGKN